MKIDIKLELTREQIVDLANQYVKENKSQEEEENIIRICDLARKQEFLGNEEFMRIATWKSPRPKKHYEKNSPELIKEVTKISFCSDCSEEMRIKILTLLEGINLRAASAILHLVFLSDNTYPLIDFRALRALTGKQYLDNEYAYELWKEYVAICRKICRDNDVDMRTLDRALWQYDKVTNGN